MFRGDRLMCSSTAGYIIILLMMIINFIIITGLKHFLLIYQYTSLQKIAFNLRYFKFIYYYFTDT